MQRISTTTVGGGGGGITIPNLIVVDSDVADIGAAVNAADTAAFDVLEPAFPVLS